MVSKMRTFYGISCCTRVHFNVYYAYFLSRSRTDDVCSDFMYICAKCDITNIYNYSQQFMKNSLSFLTSF